MVKLNKSYPQWIDGATPEESAEVSAIDKQIKVLTESRRVLSIDRALITNRCIQRARYVPRHGRDKRKPERKRK